VEAANVSQLDVGRGDERYDFVIAYMRNDTLGDLLSKLEPLSDLEVVFLPDEVIAFKPPISQAVQDIRNVAPRSPMEIYLGGLRSIGTWRSFLTYAAIGAGVVWVGFFTNTVYLVLASMLIAPFAGPAMNTAMASAAGDRVLLEGSLIRYVAALVLTALVTGGLSLLVGQSTMTTVMQGVSEVSAAAALLPLMAGGVAALTLVQSHGSHQISGATTGVAVAASLAPPAGLVGMSLAMNRWDILDNALFVLGLQLIGINLAGALVFRLYGVTPRSVRLRQGKRGTLFVSLSLSVIVLIGMLGWQFSSPLRLQRSSEETRAIQKVEQAVNEMHSAHLVHVEARFRGLDNVEAQEMLILAYVRPVEGTQLAPAHIAEDVEDTIEQAILAAEGKIIPLVEVHVVEPPHTLGP
jgi:uncharacterized membrane protein